MRLYCWASGLMQIGRTLPEGALPLAEETRDELEKIIERGRLAYDGKSWLVPGVPEAENEQEAVDAVRKFKAWAVIRCGRKV